MGAVARKVEYSGRVQGVGFRWTACEVAGRFAVAGFVRNLASGRVELVAEGEEAEIARFLAAVAERMGHKIADVVVTEEARQGYTGFSVRY